MDDFFARNRLSAYLDDELDPSERQEVEAALARSAELRAELDNLRAAVNLLRVGGPVRAAADFSRKLQARIEGQPLRVGWMRHVYRVRAEAVLLAAAAALVLVFAGKKPAEEPVAAAPAGGGDVTSTDTPAVATHDATAGGDAPILGEGDEPPAVDMAGLPGSEAGAGEAALGRKVAAPSRPTSAKVSGRKELVEREPFVPAWEQQGSGDTPPVIRASSQFRLSLTSETGLRDLDALARQYGGYLADERGKPLNPYLMESGDSRKVKLVMPAGDSLSAGQLYDRLQAFGHAELVSGDMYMGKPDKSVTIEVRRD
jgi:anti-sigma factor RsiW